jgi:hypothetical protein
MGHLEVNPVMLDSAAMNGGCGAVTSFAWPHRAPP